MEKIALLTGVSGGIGSAILDELIKLGYEVYGLDIKDIKVKEHFHFFRCDIKSEASVNDCYEKIKKEIDHLDIVIHSAGIYDLNSLIEISEDDFKNIFDINVFGVYRINKTFTPLLNKGKIVIITSELAPLDPLPFTGIYAVSKASLDKYAYSLRMEMQLLGHQVIVFRPGAIDTGLLDVSMDRLNKFKKTTTFYKEESKKFDDIVNKVEARKIHPSLLAKKIGKVISKRKPRYVYYINRNPLLRMLNALPDKTQNKIIEKLLK